MSHPPTTDAHKRPTGPATPACVRATLHGSTIVALALGLAGTTLAAPAPRFDQKPGTLLSADREAVAQAAMQGFGLPWWQVALVLTLLTTLAVALVWWWWWRRNAEGLPRPLWTFHRLASDHGVALSDQWHLYRIARAGDLSTPLALLLGRGCFDHTVNRYLATLPDARRPAERQHLRALRHRLFDTRPAPSQPKPTQPA